MTCRHGLLAGLVLAWCCLPVAAADPTGPLYSLPYPPGSAFLVGQGYFEFPTHEGLHAVDWLMPEETPILAARAGVVVQTIASFSKSGLTEDMKDKANLVVIQHDDGTYAMYVHLAQDGVKVKVGERVEEGQAIALSGNTGYSGTPHLHFMVYRMQGGQMVSIPTLFKSGTDEPYTISRGGKYLAPGGDPPPDEGPLKGIRGTGELSSIRANLIALVKASPSLDTAAAKLKRHLLDNRAAYKKAYRAAFARAQTGDKQAMRELQDFLNSMDLQSQPEIARLVADPEAGSTASEALAVWWDLFSL
jgi:hypothetical protein